MDAFITALRDVKTPVLQRPKVYNDRCKVVLDYIDDCIDEAVSRVQSNGEGTDRKQVRIIDELVKATQDRHDLKYLIVSNFSPAHDTVAVTLSNAFFHLARNPNCWTKLREEIRPTASEPLTFELLNTFKYMNWILRKSGYLRFNKSETKLTIFLFSSSLDTPQRRHRARMSLDNCSTRRWRCGW